MHLAWVCVAYAQTSSPWVLCLHGGGGNGAGFKKTPLMQTLETQLSGLAFVYPDAPNTHWLNDVNPDKSVTTNDPDWDLPSRTLLDAIVASRGPMLGIIGYSQGGAYAPAYAATMLHKPTFLMMFMAYLPTTQTAIVQRIQNFANDATTQTLFWHGSNDGFYSLGVELSNLFSAATVITTDGGHALPTSGLDQAVAFMQGATNTTAVGSSAAKLDTYAIMGIALGAGSFVVGGISTLVYCRNKQPRGQDLLQ